MKSIKHSGSFGKRGTERQEPYYLARNRCEVEFDLEDIIPGRRAVLYYAPREMYDGNGILVSEIVKVNHIRNYYDKTFLNDSVIVETENSIYELEGISNVWV